MTATTTTPLYVEADGETVFQAHSLNTRYGTDEPTLWNGFVSPLFTTEQARVIMDAINAEADENPDLDRFEYDADNDLFIVVEADEIGQATSYDVETVEREGVRLHLIGGGAWTWNVTHPRVYEVHTDRGENVSNSPTGDFATRTEADADRDAAQAIRPDMGFDIVERHAVVGLSDNDDPRVVHSDCAAAYIVEHPGVADDGVQPYESGEFCAECDEVLL